MERVTTILLVAGLGFFGFAFTVSALYPWMITDRGHPEVPIEELAAEITPEFRDLRTRWPVAFDEAFPRIAESPAAKQAWQAEHANALRRGRAVYVREGCWHCHSQLIRPVAEEEKRWGGPPRSARMDHHELHRPVLWGTRRVGPDLSYEGGLRSNDWHAAHFWDPRSTSPDSVMPSYRWFFREGWQVFRRIDPAVADFEGVDPDLRYAIPGIHPDSEAAQAALAAHAKALEGTLEAERERLFVAPSRGFAADGLALLAYLQWLGTWPASELEPATEERP